jgi:hypothetical protein
MEKDSARSGCAFSAASKKNWLKNVRPVLVAWMTLEIR